MLISIKSNMSIWPLLHSSLCLSECLRIFIIEKKKSKYEFGTKPQVSNSSLAVVALCCSVTQSCLTVCNRACQALEQLFSFSEPQLPH